MNHLHIYTSAKSESNELITTLPNVMLCYAYALSAMTKTRSPLRDEAWSCSIHRLCIDP